jgi:uncharacterized glyoxalase superfamily protein PhnB
VHESGHYGELEVESKTTLAFASHSLGTGNLGHAFVKCDPNGAPLGIEIGFVCDNVQSAYDRAIEAGARSVKTPEVKPWGQTVAYLRGLDGEVVELCSRVSDLKANS